MIAPMPFSTLSLAIRGSLAVIRLNRPAEGNPIDGLFLDELDVAAAALADDPAVSVVQLRAAGDVFSSGWSGPPPPSDRLLFRCLEVLPQPVIAVLGGDASGAGLELALACDVRLTHAGARFATQLPAGSPYWFGGTQRLPRLIGRPRAAEMLLFGESVTAERALAWGLVNSVAAEPVSLDDTADRLSSVIASRGPLALRYAKEAISRGLDMPLDQALRYETDLTVILQTTADRAEGVRAFLEKRPPSFEGR
jgi:enoyl-CoA hydratase